VSAAASRSPPGARGVLFLPHLRGERSPFRDDAARGALLGLGAASGRDDVARAVLEGTSMHARALLEALLLAEQSPNSNTSSLLSGGGDAAPLVVVGGGAQSGVWLGILADALRRPLRSPPGASFAACRGAAGWAFAGLSAWGGQATPPPEFFHACGADGGGLEAVPDAARAASYDALYDGWRAAHPALAAAGLQGGAASRAAWRAGRA
jgi:xylulokinase